ncbi:MAG: hypothetical protein N3G20_02860, partial [Verrucomicrobiae bacterium]|nr:hypothetical protein [Verrucomicrobiae bacterium]
MQEGLRVERAGAPHGAIALGIGTFTALLWHKSVIKPSPSLLCRYRSGGGLFSRLVEDVFCAPAGAENRVWGSDLGKVGWTGEDGSWLGSFEQALRYMTLTKAGPNKRSMSWQLKGVDRRESMVGGERLG